jgi:queuosine precursor transporter
LDKRPDYKLMLLMGFFTAFYVMANIFAFKKVEVGPLVLTMGLLCFPFLFLITDTISEVYGKVAAQKMVGYGFVVMASILVLIQVAIHIPPAGFFLDSGGQSAFAMVMGSTLRITLASMAAYLVSQYHDVWAFHFWKDKTNGKHLWLRNNLSTITSQAFDSVIFIVLAFYGRVPNEVIWSMILGQWLVKWVIALLDTPFCYLMVAWARDDSKNMVA